MENTETDKSSLLPKQRPTFHREQNREESSSSPSYSNVSNTTTSNVGDGKAQKRLASKKKRHSLPIKLNNLTQEKGEEEEENSGEELKERKQSKSITQMLSPGRRSRASSKSSDKRPDMEQIQLKIKEKEEKKRLQKEDPNLQLDMLNPDQQKEKPEPSPRDRLTKMLFNGSKIMKKKDKEGKKEDKKKKNNINNQQESKDDLPPLNFDLNSPLPQKPVSLEIIDFKPEETNKIRGFNVLSRMNSFAISERKKVVFLENTAKLKHELEEKDSEEFNDFIEEFFNKDEGLRNSICGIRLDGTCCRYPINKICATTTIGFCTVLGLFPSSPMAGTLVWSIGDTLNITKGGGDSVSLTVTTMLVITPVFLRQFYERGQRITEGIFVKEKWLNDYTYQKTAVDYVMNALTAVASSIEASVYLGAMILAEKQFPIFIAITGAPFFLSWLERYYDIGTNSLHNLLVRYFYDTKGTQYKRSVLLERFKESEKAIEDIEPDNVTNKELMDSFFINKNEEEDDERIDSTPLEKFLEHLSTLSTAWAALGRLAGSEYIIERILTEYFSADPLAASQTAWSFALYELAFKTVVESQTQKEFFRNTLKAFSLSHDWPWTRKITSVLTLVSGGLFAFTRTVPALENFNRWLVPGIVKYLFAGASFVVDFGYYQEFWNEKLQNIITSLVMRVPERHTTESEMEWIRQSSQMTYLQKWRQDITKGIKNLWNGKTISMVFEKYGTRNHRPDGYHTI